MNELSSIRNVLYYDRRRRGNAGLCLRVDLFHVVSPLRAGDRVEPTANLLDVGRVFDFLEPDLPVELTLWRPAQVRVKHRNPRYDPSIDITSKRMIVDSLHALSLGVLLVFSRELVWALF